MKSSYFLSKPPLPPAAAGLRCTRVGADEGNAGAALGTRPKSDAVPIWGAADGAADTFSGFLGLSAGPESRRTRSEAGTMDVTVLSWSARGILTTVEAAWIVGLEPSPLGGADAPLSL